MGPIDELWILKYATQVFSFRKHKAELYSAGMYPLVLYWIIILGFKKKGKNYLNQRGKCKQTAVSAQMIFGIKSQV